MILFPSCTRRVYLLVVAAILTLISQADGQEKTADLLMRSSCEQALPIASQMLKERGFTLHHPSTCTSCFEGSTVQIHDASGNAVSATTAYKRYVDRRYFPHSNIFRWYKEREFHAAAHLIAKPYESSCKISLIFGFSFYGIELIAGLPVDGDRIQGKSNLRLETEYLQHLQSLPVTANP